MTKNEQIALDALRGILTVEQAARHGQHGVTDRDIVSRFDDVRCAVTTLISGSPKRTEHVRRNAFLAQELDSQIRWIDDHGGDLVGYVVRYGTPGTDHCYGDGGEVIYRADLDHLHQIERLLGIRTDDPEMVNLIETRRRADAHRRAAIVRGEADG